MKTLSCDILEKILNLGCGLDKYGTHRIDVKPLDKDTIKCDINKEKLPFPNNFFDKVYCRNMIMYVSNYNNFIMPPEGNHTF